MKLLKYAALTHPGRVRTNNEDNLYIDGKYRTDVDEAFFEASGTASSNSFTAAVFDGMGGEADGEVASLYAAETLDKHLKRGAYGGGKKTVESVINEANERICDRVRQENRRMGTTLAILDFYDDKVDAINIGDSRIYCVDDKGLQQLSVDHTTVGSMVRSGQITKEEARTHKLRHQLLQHLGIFEEEMMLEPEKKEGLALEEGARYLICSDGLTDMVTDEEIKKILSSVNDIVEAANTLLNMALERGGKDNTTVVLIEVGADGEGVIGKSKVSIDKLLISVIGSLLVISIVILLIMILKKEKANEDDYLEYADDVNLQEIVAGNEDLNNGDISTDLVDVTKESSDETQDIISEDSTSENAVSDNSISDNSVSDKAISDNSASENSAIDNDNSVSADSLSNNSISDNSVSDNAVQEEKILDRLIIKEDVWK